MDFRNKIFELIENEQGLANSHTRMMFDNSAFPYEATYSGSNVSNGHVLVTNINGRFEMIYHALTSEGNLVAGKAKVNIESINDDTQMQLEWQWLTGDLSAGISTWKEVKA